MGTPRWRLATGSVVLAIVALSGCGGGDDDDDDSASGTTVAETTTTTTPPLDEGAEKEAAATALEEFFTRYSTGDFAAAAEVMENGDVHLQEFQTLYDTFMVGANALGAVAKDVNLVSETEAEVIYDLSFGGTVALPDSSGLVTKVDGEWKFSESSWNALVALSEGAA